MRASRDLAQMNRIATYVRGKFECSMGEIDIELGIPVWKQYVLYRSFKEFFPDVELRRSRWRNKMLGEPVVVPMVSQETLVGDGVI